MVNAAVDPQPNETGVGFSYGDKRDYIDDEDGVGEDLYQFLQVRRSKAFLSIQCTNFMLTRSRCGAAQASFSLSIQCTVSPAELGPV